MNHRRASAVMLAVLAAMAAATAHAQNGPGGPMRTPDPVDIGVADSFDVPAADAKTETIVSAAQDFLGSLSDDQRAVTVFPLDDNQQRVMWSNFPGGVFERNGVSRGNLTEEQVSLLDALLKAVLSDNGWQNTRWQMAADDWLAENDPGAGNGPGGGLLFSSNLYFVSFVGEPAPDAPWMLQFGGHHLAYNVTVFGPDLSFAPMLTGGQPTHLPVDGEDTWITRAETEAAHALMESLSEEQRAKAIRGEDYIQLVAGPGEDDATIAPEGIAASDLLDDQAELLMALVGTRLGFANDDDATALLERVRADLGETTFGWWGPVDGGPAYWRITGPTILMEFSPQEIGGDPVDHVHAMYRDPTNDYGAKWLSGE